MKKQTNKKRQSSPLPAGHSYLMDFLSTCTCVLSHVQLFSAPWTVARQTLSTEFSRQEHWTGLPFLIPGDIPDPEIEPASPESPTLAGGFFYHWVTWEAPKMTSHAGCEYRESTSCSAMCGSLQLHDQSTGFSRQEFWSGSPFPSPGGSSQPRFSATQADSCLSELTVLLNFLKNVYIPQKWIGDGR